LKALEADLVESARAREALDREIAEIRSDGARLSAALIKASRRAQATEERIRGLEQRLAPLTGSEAGIRRSLEARRGVVIEVLAALQRIGRRPPPAVLVAPEDMLRALRTAMLLGAVLPELRSEAVTLADDLAELIRLRTAIAADRDVLKGELAALAREKLRLDALVEARQSRGSEIEREARSERERAQGLGLRATSLKELIERMERESSARLETADAAKRGVEARLRESRERFAAAAVRDPARLAPKTPFAEARGLLRRPVAGEVTRGFGAPTARAARRVASRSRPGPARW
jgi:septal ring factor EnvC (AmiA/AmiB activator)